MIKSNIAIAEAYYSAMGKKDIKSLSKYLHPDIQFTHPLDSMTGKEAVIEATQKFISLFETLTIRAKLDSEDQAMIVYDLHFPAPMGTFSSSALMTIQDGLITKIELFYDARPFDKK